MQWFRKFAADREGSVFMLVGLSILVIVAIGGAAIDFGAQQLVRAKLQSATDAAALAYINMPDGSTKQQRKDMAQRYYELNAPATYMGVKRPPFTLSYSGTKVIISTGNVVVPTHFIFTVHIYSLPLQVTSTVDVDEEPTPTSYDIILAIDNSGSMNQADVGEGSFLTLSGGQQAATHASAANFCVNYYVNSGWLGLPGYTEALFRGWCNGYPDDSSTGVAYGLTTEDRLNAVRSSALSLATTLLNTPNTESRVGVATWSSIQLASLPLTRDLSAIEGLLNGMFAFGATNSTLGLQKAQELGADYNANHVRAVVLLTDGVNTVMGPFQVNANQNMYDAKGCDTKNYCSYTNDDSLAICTTLKNSGVLVYTIAFGKDVTTGPDAANARAFLAACANPGSLGGSNEGEYFFAASDAATLASAFTKITKGIKKIRLITNEPAK